MHIAFKFNYIHDNGLFGRLLARIAERAPLDITIYREKREYGIEATGDQEELETLAELVSAMVPKSLFLKGHTVEAVDVRREPYTADGDEGYVYQVPYCPECQQKVMETLDAFAPCSVCGFSDTALSLEELSSFTQVDASSSETLFSTLAERLVEKNEITLPTYNGVRRLSLLGEIETDESGILICDPSDLSSSFLITQGELDTMSMVEKPSVRLKPKLRFRSEHDLHRPFYPVFFADDKITLALSIALSRKGIFAVYCDRVPDLCAASALEHHVIVGSGRDMLPWHHHTDLQQLSCCGFKGFEAIGDGSGVRLDRSEKMLDAEGCVRFVADEDVSPDKNSVLFEPAHAVLRSVVLEQELQGKSLCGIYLSRQHHSQICSFSSKIGYLPMVDFLKETLQDPKTMLTSIAQMDEAGERLVANYRKAHPKLFAQIEAARFDRDEQASMLSRLWAMAAIFIGISEGGDLQNACDQLEATALEFGGKSGPRIDYKVLKTEQGYQLDPRLAIRSAMSFKLAGVDEYLLSFGFIDSLADFIAQQAEMADANIAIDGVALGGSLFENRQLLMRTYNALSPNYRIHRNERLGMDGANVAVGAVTLGSE